jgi:hypothetical protein
MKKNTFLLVRLYDRKPCLVTEFGLKRPNIGTGASQTKNKFAARIYMVPLRGTGDPVFDAINCNTNFGFRPNEAEWVIQRCCALSEQPIAPYISAWRTRF